MNYVEGLVSIIIPVYNAELFIRKTIEAVIAQTYRFMEIIVIDDCSTDKSFEIVREYVTRYPNIIRYYRLKQNSGVSRARNVGLKYANGQYIAFQDSDDLWKSDKVEKQIKLLKKSGAVLCYTAIEIINVQGKVIKSKRSVKEIFSYQELLKNTMIATSSVIVNRCVSGRFRMPKSRSKSGKFYMAEDYATWLRLLRLYGNAVGINEALVQYRVGNGGLSSGKLKSLKRVYRAQTRLEHINPLFAIINCGLYVFNGVKKHIF